MKLLKKAREYVYLIDNNKDNEDIFVVQLETSKSELIDVWARRKCIRDVASNYPTIELSDQEYKFLYDLCENFNKTLGGLEFVVDNIKYKYTLDTGLVAQYVGIQKAEVDDEGLAINAQKYIKLSNIIRLAINTIYEKAS